MVQGISKSKIQTLREELDSHLGNYLDKVVLSSFWICISFAWLEKWQDISIPQVASCCALAFIS